MNMMMDMMILFSYEMIPPIIKLALTRHKTRLQNEAWNSLHWWST